MSGRRRLNTRLIAIVLLAGAVLVAVVIATGGTNSTSSPGPTSGPATPVAQSTGPVLQIQGAVTVSVRHLAGHTWEFWYRVRNTGRVPLAGFEISSATANLFHIRGRSGWSYYGSGVCGGQHPGVLIYWSTSTASPRIVKPGHRAHFIFDVNTSGPTQVRYSLSWDSAAPQFGTVQGPAGSVLKASGKC